MTNQNVKIKSVKAREILDSRGFPTVEAEVETEFGFFYGAVPSGASKGKYEAKELRDGGKRYLGQGVAKAVRNINEIISPKLTGKDARQQKELDDLMIKLDGTKDKSKLGANAVLPVSLAVCRAGAKAKNISLYQYIRQISSDNTFSAIAENVLSAPMPCFNIINGGVHAGNDLDIQEFMVVPRVKHFSEALQVASETYHTLKKILKEKFGGSAINIGDEGGFAPGLKFTEQALDFILEAIEKAGYENKVDIILDAAATEFFQGQRYKMKEAVFTRDGLLRYYSRLVAKYPIIGLEDPFAEDDWQGWEAIMSNVKYQMSNLLVIGDDLLATNLKRIKEAKEKQACNGLILKPNQIGTVSETIKAAELARSYGWKIMVSHRSGETNDDFISDLAIGIGADFIKAGAPARGERVSKYNRLLRIEQEFKIKN